MDPQQPTNTQPDNLQTPPTPSEPKNKKILLIVIAIIVALGILGGIMFAILGSNKDTSNNTNSQPNSPSKSTTPASDKYQKYDVTDKTNGVTFSVSFYKDAKVEEKNGRTYLNSGEAGSMYSIYLGVATSDKIDCSESPTTTMLLGGKSTTICYKADNTQYAGYADTKSGTVKLNLGGQKPISMDEAKTIMESVTFK